MAGPGVALRAVPGAGGRGPNIVLALDPARAERPAIEAPPGMQVKVHLSGHAAITDSAPWLAGADVLVVEVDIERVQQFEAFARIVAELNIPVAAAARALTVDATRRLMRAGAIDVLPLPIVTADLAHAVDEAVRSRPMRPGSAAPARSGKVVAFLGAMGGVGVTTLVTQAGCLWAETARVCLIDFDVQFGSAALYLNMKPQLNLVDLTEAGERLDAEIMQTVAALHSSGLSVVAAPAEMMPLEMLTPAAALHILDVAQASFDLVLIDLPTAWTEWSLAVLSRADATVLVSSLSVPGIHHARRKLDLMDANALPSKVVLNRVPRPLFRTIDLADTEKVMRRPIDFTISNDYPVVSGAVDQGRTLAQVKPKSRVEKDVAALVAGVNTMLAQADA